MANDPKTKAISMLGSIIIAQVASLIASGIYYGDIVSGKSFDDACKIIGGKYCDFQSFLLAILIMDGILIGACIIVILFAQLGIYRIAGVSVIFWTLAFLVRQIIGIIWLCNEIHSDYVKAIVVPDKYYYSYIMEISVVTVNFIWGIAFGFFTRVAILDYKEKQKNSSNQQLLGSSVNRNM